MDANAIKQTLTELASKFTVAGGGQAQAGQAVPLSVGPLPANLAIPRISEKVYKIDQVTKDVMMTTPSWPGDPLRNEQVLGPKPLLKLDGTPFPGTPGSIGRLEVRIPELTTESSPITVEVTWEVFNDAACSQASSEVTLTPANTSATLLIEPPIEEWTNSWVAGLRRRWVRAKVTLKVTTKLPDPNNPAVLVDTTIASTQVTTPAVEVQMPAIGIPTICGLWDAGNFGGAVLVILPSNSPLAGLAAVTDVASSLKNLVTAAAPVAALGPFVALLPAVTDLANKLSSASTTVLRVADRLPDLGKVVMWTESGFLGFKKDITANDLFGSLILVSGNSAKGVRLYNRYDYVPDSSLFHDGGAFTVRAGALRFSRISDFGTKSPTSEPSQTVENLTSPKGSTTTFTNHVSSLEYV